MLCEELIKALSKYNPKADVTTPYSEDIVLAYNPDGDESYKNRAVCYAWFIWDNMRSDDDTYVKWLI